MSDILWSRSRLVVKELMEALDETRRIEKTNPHKLPYDFGNLKDANLARPPRLIWMHQGGIILEMVQQAPQIVVISETPHTVAPVTVPAIGYRRSNYLVRIWAEDITKAEIILDQLVTSSRLINRSDSYVFANMQYSVPTELEGKWNETGAVIDAVVGVRTSVPSVPIGAYQDVVVQGNEWRAGITQVQPFTEDLDESTTYDPDRLTGDPSWPG